jgi:glycosyltransferase involved in cell wall biosynthesis
MLAIVAERWDPDRGGRERYAADLVVYLQAAGRQVTRAKPDRLVRHDGARILALTPMSGATHYQLHGGLFASAFEGERESMPSIVRRALFRRALTLNRRRQRLIDDEKRVFDGQAELMAFSEATARELVSRGVSRSRIRVSRPGVDLKQFHPDGADVPHCAGTSVRLAFAGHNFALKGLPAAIQTVARLRRGGLDASLTVAGRGLIRAFRRIAEREGVGEHVRFVGTVSQHQVADLYRSSDALIHPTFYDPFPRVVIEALACGCPVITTARCGAAEILTHGQHGFVVRDPRDVAAFADAISQMTPPDKRGSVRRAAAELGQSFDGHHHFREVSGWIFAEDHA